MTSNGQFRTAKSTKQKWLIFTSYPHYPPFRVSLKLYDVMIVPILCFGCELRGVYKDKCLETILSPTQCNYSSCSWSTTHPSVVERENFEILEQTLLRQYPSTAQTGCSPSQPTKVQAIFNGAGFSTTFTCSSARCIFKSADTRIYVVFHMTSWGILRKLLIYMAKTCITWRPGEYSLYIFQEVTLYSYADSVSTQCTCSAERQLQCEYRKVLNRTPYFSGHKIIIFFGSLNTRIAASRYNFQLLNYTGDSLS